MDFKFNPNHKPKPNSKQDIFENGNKALIVRALFLESSLGYQSKSRFGP